MALDESQCRRLGGTAAGEYVTLAITDDGCGMDAATRAHVFEPFFTTKDTGEGTGLGLATVYGIVSQNHGLVELLSRPGMGTTVRLYLQRYRGPDGVAEEVDRVQRVAGGRETILLVEDEPAVLEMVATKLNELGYHVLSAATPTAALHLASEHSDAIAVVVTDMVMPEMSGRQLVSELVGRRPGLRQVYMSGYPADVVAEHGELGDGVVFLQKPFTAAQLAAAVRRALAEP